MTHLHIGAAGAPAPVAPPAPIVRTRLTERLGTIARIAATDPPTRGDQLRSRFRLQNAARRLVPFQGVGKCLRATRPIPVRAPEGWESAAHPLDGAAVPIARRVRPGEALTTPAAVDVYVSPDGGAHYGGLHVCGSVHVCPVCAPKIAEVRRGELAAAIAAHGATGGQVLLITYTVAHALGDDLKSLLGDFLAALRSLRARRGYKALKAQFGVVGHIRALEVTHGASGWHPHVHELLFIAPTDRPCTIAAHIRRLLYAEWASAAQARGLVTSALHGLDVQHTRGAIGDYIAKFGKFPATDSAWGVEAELTKAHHKRGRTGSSTPWDMLRHVEETGELDGREALCFIEYARAFKGRHQLQWSRGLRAILLPDIEAQTDEQISERQDAGAVKIGSLTLIEWRMVLRANARAEVLALAADGGWEVVEGFVSSLMFRRPPDPVRVGRLIVA